MADLTTNAEETRTALPPLDLGQMHKMFEVAPIPGVGTNLGFEDSRRPVLVSEHEYDAVVSVSDAGNEEFCTATVVEIEGFSLTRPGSLIATAAHCVEDADPNGLTMRGNYLDENGIPRSYTMQSDEIWTHPFYEDYNKGLTDGTVDSRADFALIYSEDTLPPDVKPAELDTLDVEGTKRKIEALAEEKLNAEGAATEPAAEASEYEIPEYTVAGFSGDKAGLWTHENSSLAGYQDGVLMTDADTAQRASGGPMFEAGENGEPMAFNENGQPIVSAVNSAGDRVSEDNLNPEYVYGTALDENVLPTVPFIRENGEDMTRPVQTATVTAESGLNIRYGPAEDHNKLVTDENGPSGVPWGEKVTVHNSGENHLSKEWALVTGPDGRTGYVSGEYLEMDEQPEIGQPSGMEQQSRAQPIISRF